MCDVYVCVCMYHSERVEVRGQLLGLYLSMLGLVLSAFT